MSVATRNPFALLDAEDSSRPSTPPTAPKADTPSAPQPTRGGQRGARGGPGSRGGRYYQRGGARTNAPRDSENPDTTPADDAAGEGKKRFDGEGRGRGRGRGRARADGGRGGRGGRNFDRHSATGKTDSEKKVHQGWGGDEAGSELKAEAGGATDAAVEATGDDGWGVTPTADAWGSSETPAPAEGEAAAAAAEGEKPAEGRRGRDREPEEDNTLTLDQYIKQQKEKELDIIPKLETRKANEGDDSIWKDAVAIAKKDEDEDAYFVGKTKAATKVTKSKKDEKVFLEIDARFERPRGGRGRGGDRGDRGDRARGGRGRGRGRANGNGNSAPALNVDDQTAFPSLS